MLQTQYYILVKWIHFKLKHIVSGVLFSPCFPSVSLVEGACGGEDGFSLGLPAAPAVRSMAAWMAGLDFMFAHSYDGLCGRQFPGAYDGHLISLGGDKSSPSAGFCSLLLRACCLVTAPEFLGAGKLAQEAELRCLWLSDWPPFHPAHTTSPRKAHRPKTFLEY